MSAAIEAVFDAQAPSWPTPQPLTQHGGGTEYPLQVLPDMMRDAVQEVQSYVQSPIPLVAQSALCALSIAAQAHYNVQRDNTLSSPVSLFMFALGDSGERKTSGDGYFNRPIVEHEAQQREREKSEQAQYKADKCAWEAELSGIEQALKADVKSGKSTQRRYEQLHDLQEDEPVQPYQQRILVSDATPEALLRRLATVWPACAVCSDEGGVVLGSHGMGKDSQMRNLATLCSLWGGQSYSADRVSRESIVLENPRLSIAIQVQLMTLQRFIEQSAGMGRGSGFFARVLMSAPESTQGTRLYKAPPDEWPALNRYNDRISELLRREVRFENRTLAPTTLALDDDAKAVWVSYHNAIESQLGRNGALHDLRDVASKIAENAARLAALFEVLEADGEPESIGKVSMNRAIAVATWHLGESQRLFGELAVPQAQKNIAELDRWLCDYCEREGTREVPRRAILQYGPGRLRDSAALQVATDELQEYGRIRDRKSGRARVIEVSPYLVSDQSDES